MSRKNLASIAAMFIIPGSTSFSNHPTWGYVSLSIGFAILLFAFFLAKKHKKNEQQA